MKRRDEGKRAQGTRKLLVLDSPHPHKIASVGAALSRCLEPICACLRLGVVGDAAHEVARCLLGDKHPMRACPRGQRKFSIVERLRRIRLRCRLGTKARYGLLSAGVEYGRAGEVKTRAGSSATVTVEA